MRGVTTTDIIITRLVDSEGYRALPKRQGPRMSPARASEILSKINATEADSDFRSFVKRETDVGRVFDNEDRFNGMIQDIQTLSDAGVIQPVEPPKDSILASIVGGLSWGTMKRDEARLLAELRAQGVRELMKASGDLPKVSADQVFEQVQNDMAAFASARGLNLTPVSEKRYEQASIHDAVNLLLATNPHDGLTEMQEFVVHRRPMIAQGATKKSYEHDNMREDYEALVQAGVLPRFSFPKKERSGFFARLAGVVGDVFSPCPANEDLPELCQRGQDVLRAHIEERLRLRNDVSTPSPS